MAVTLLRTIKSRVPKPLKRKVRQATQELTRQIRRPFKQAEFRSALQQIVRTAPGEPGDEVLERLVAGWDNPAAGDLDYLRAVIDVAREARGPILECGSGLTTFLLAAFASEPVWTLEGDERWYGRVAAELQRAGLHSAHVVYAPLRAYDGFHWYQLPEGLPASFSAVVCDGPAAGGLEGGRVGLMALLGERIVSGAPIVVDRAMVYEATVVAIWEADFGLTSEDPSTDHRVYRTP